MEGSDILANWITDIGGTVGGDIGNKVGEAEDVLGTIPGDKGGGSAAVSTLGR